MSLKLRPLEKYDLEAATQCGLAAWISAIAPLLDDFLPHELVRIEAAFRMFLASHLTGNASAGNELVIADLGGQVVGFYNFDFAAKELTDLWVGPQWQGHGIATSMMHHAKQSAFVNGVGRMLLEVMTGNQRAIAFYRKEGFFKYDHKVIIDPTLNRQVDKTCMQVYLGDHSQNSNRRDIS